MSDNVNINLFNDKPLYCYISNTARYGYKIWPYSVHNKGDEVLYKLIDEDLTRAFETLTTNFGDGYNNKKEKLNMSVEQQIEEARNEGYKKGYQHGCESNKQTVNSGFGYTGFKGAEVLKDKYVNNKEASYNGNRMDAVEERTLRCPNCQTTLFAHNLLYGVIYEHAADSGCEYAEKYIYLKKRLLKSE
jgi:hypothetical protein